MADDVVELLDALQIAEPVVLGGLSMGGYVALSLVARYPERFRALMLMDTRADGRLARGRPRTARSWRGRSRRRGERRAGRRRRCCPKLFSEATRQRRPELVAPVRDADGEDPAAGVAGALRGMAARPDRTGDLAAIAVPTLVLVGADDAITPPDEARGDGRGAAGRPARRRPRRRPPRPAGEPRRRPTRAILEFLAGLWLSRAPRQRRPLASGRRATDNPGQARRSDDPVARRTRARWRTRPRRTPDRDPRRPRRAGRATSATAGRFAFDTEFVSEETFEPVLCLIQVATRDRLAVVDPLAVGDLAPFWDVVDRPGGRGRHARGGRGPADLPVPDRDGPARVFDVQIAAGLVGFGYPLSLGNLVHQALRVSLLGGETRTDWRRRPLSAAQLRYALDDVRHLLDLADQLAAELAALGPGDWAEAEFAAFLDAIQNRAEEDRWRRLPGPAPPQPPGPGGRPAALRVAGRGRPAARTGRSASVLRDDLLVAIAKRQPANRRDLEALRDFNRPHLLSQARRDPRRRSPRPRRSPPSTSPSPPSGTTTGRAWRWSSACCPRRCRSAAPRAGSPSAWSGRRTT